MSVVNTILGVQSENALLASGHSDDFVVLSGKSVNQRFTARLDVEPVIDPDFSLGPDPRMSSVLRVMRPGPSLSHADTIRTDEGTRYKVLKLLDNNASTATTDYLLEQQL